jgi:hypothetical protein
MDWVVILALIVAIVEILEALYWRCRLVTEREVTSALVRVFLRRSLALRPQDVDEICQLLRTRREPLC